MPQDRGFTYDELVKMGAKPGGYSLEEVQALGGKPTEAAKAPDARTAGEVALDQTGAVIRGIPKAVTGIPGMLSEGAGALWDLASGKGTERTGNMISGAVGGIVQPFKTAGQGLAALAMPETVQGPTDQEWEQAAEGAGTQLGAALLPKVIPPIAKAVGRGAEMVGGILKNPAEVNRWMGVSAKDIMTGAAPGERVLSEKLLANSKTDTLANIKRAKAEAGNAIDQRLRPADASGQTIDVRSIVNDAIADAEKKWGIKSDDAFMKKLEQFGSDVEGSFADASKLKPSEAFEAKVKTGQSTNFDIDSPSQTEFNKMAKRIYGEISEQIKKTAPGIQDDLSRWQDLNEAEQAIKKGIAKDKVGTGTGTRKQAQWDKIKKPLGVGIALAGAPAATKKILDLIP